MRFSARCLSRAASFPSPAKRRRPRRLATRNCSSALTASRASWPSFAVTLDSHDAALGFLRVWMGTWRVCQISCKSNLKYRIHQTSFICKFRDARWRASLELSEEEKMSGVRLLVGTRKGAFILTSDGKREKWDISGPHFAGWEI